jgi:FAD synthetase
LVEKRGLALLRAVYLRRVREGRARTDDVRKDLSIDASTFREELRSVVKRRLIKVSKGEVQLTASGRRKLRVVMVGGAFEIIHPGHIHTMSEARRLGNTLIVVVATDESVKRSKGRDPVTEQDLRVKLVSSLKLVDLALPGNKGSIFDILPRIRPDVVAVGYDQRHDPNEIVKEAARRGLTITAQRLNTPLPDLKSSKILLSL